MKMSDVFDLPLDDAEFGVYDSVCDKVIGGFANTNGNKAAVHAINQHDALVAMNAELVTTLEFQLGNDYIHRKTKDEIRYQIKRAKELNQ